MKTEPALLVIDNQSNYLKRFKRDFLDQQPFKTIFFDHDEPLRLEKENVIKGVLLSGGKGNPYEPLNLTSNFVALMNFNVPTIGFCLGYEIIAVSYFAPIRKLPTYQNRKEIVTLTAPDDPLFEGLNKNEIRLQEKHRYHVPSVTPPLEMIGHSAVCPVEIIRHQDKPIYGFQSHPEVSGQDGHRIMCNFLRMCDLPVDETVCF